MGVQSLSGLQLFAVPWAVAHQAPLSMGFSRQENWSGLPFPTTRDLPHPEIEPVSPALAGRFLPVCYLESPRLKVYLEVKVLIFLRLGFLNSKWDTIFLTVLLKIKIR